MARYEAAIELANPGADRLVIDATESDGWSPEQVSGDELQCLVPVGGGAVRSL